MKPVAPVRRIVLGIVVQDVGAELWGDIGEREVERGDLGYMLSVNAGG